MLEAFANPLRDFEIGVGVADEDMPRHTHSNLTAVPICTGGV
jgi:hypothetical protein